MYCDFYATYYIPSRILDEKFIFYNSKWLCAKEAAIHYDICKLTYSNHQPIIKRKNQKCRYTIAVNAGHGTVYGEKHKVYQVPKHLKNNKYINEFYDDINVMVPAIASGWTNAYKYREADYVLLLARILKDKLIKAGFNVLMLRDSKDCRLDNIARTIMANYHADCHIALHLDATSNDKGALCVLMNEKMKYVKKNYSLYDLLNRCMIMSLINNHEKIDRNIKQYKNLTQANYSSIPFCCIELGDHITVWDVYHIENMCNTIANGFINYFKQIR